MWDPKSVSQSPSAEVLVMETSALLYVAVDNRVSKTTQEALHTSHSLGIFYSLSVTFSLSPLSSEGFY